MKMHTQPLRMPEKPNLLPIPAPAPLLLHTQHLCKILQSSTSAGAVTFARFCFRRAITSPQRSTAPPPCAMRNTLWAPQNLNGPCPLLAIANVLLLRNCIHISESAARIATQDLLALVAEYIVASNKCSSPTLYFYTSPLPPLTQRQLLHRDAGSSRRSAVG